MWNLNERDGRIDQAKGKVKQAVADLTGDDQLETEGKIDETRGNAKTAFGGEQRKVGAAVASVSQPVKR